MTIANYALFIYGFIEEFLSSENKRGENASQILQKLNF